MAWIELHQSLWTHRKTFALADELGIDETYAAAHLARFWTWALDNVPSGDLTNITARAIARGAGWNGDPDKFAQSLITSGWVDATEDTETIHDWESYAGRLIERREANAQRARTSRERNAQRAVLPNTTEQNPTEGSNEPLPLAAKQITEAFRAEMRQEFPDLDEAAEFDRATNHVAYRKAIDKRRYYRNWLNNARKYNRERRNGQNGIQPRRNPQSKLVSTATPTGPGRTPDVVG